MIDPVSTIILPEAAVADAKAYARIVTSDEDELVGRLTQSAAELCEAFIGQALLVREFSEIVPACGAWQRLSVTPVRSIGSVESMPADGAPVALAVDTYCVDIDANGDGWVRARPPSDSTRVLVSFEAGLATEWTDIPQALRQGIVRLAAHLYYERDRPAGTAPPAAVTALWRPWRRMRLT